MNAKEISFILNELGENREDYFNAVAPPVMQTSNFAFTTVHQLREALKDEASVFLYSKSTNPTIRILAEKIAALDGAEASLIFNSGSGAIFTSVLSNVKSGDHIISVDSPYTWAKNLFDKILPRFNITTTYVDGRDIRNFEQAIQENTRLIYLESPNSWNFHLQDLEAVAKLARPKNILTVCDNSYCTGIYQQPINMGIDLVLQSATKYINGHSDVVAGTLSGNKDMIQKIFYSEYMNMGISTSPFNAWLMIRGLRTLSVRLERISATTKKVVNFLKSRHEVEMVLFPFDEEFPQYQLARKQMTGACGLLSFVLKALHTAEIEAFCEGLQHILMAVSWGGHESLIIPGVSVIAPGEFNPDVLHHRTVRFYVGLEDADYLIQDLQKGFEEMNSRCTAHPYKR